MGIYSIIHCPPEIRLWVVWSWMDLSKCGEQMRRANAPYIYWVQNRRDTEGRYNELLHSLMQEEYYMECMFFFLILEGLLSINSVSIWWLIDIQRNICIHAVISLFCGRCMDWPQVFHISIDEGMRLIDNFPHQDVCTSKNRIHWVMHLLTNWYKHP